MTEVYEHPGASTVLRCGVPRKLKEFHKIQIFWLRDMRRIMPTVGIDIMESVSSNDRFVRFFSLFVDVLFLSVAIFVAILSVPLSQLLCIRVIRGTQSHFSA